MRNLKWTLSALNGLVAGCLFVSGTLHAELLLAGGTAAPAPGLPAAVAASLPERSELAGTTLPDSPGFSSFAVAPEAIPFYHPDATVPPIAPKSQFTIKAGQTGQPLTVADKFRFATTTIVSPFGFVGSLASAGLSHVTDSRPHFGTDSAGFGERLGSTVYRSDVKAIFGYGVFPALFHDDPRFYVLGDAVPFKQRVLYAATRVVIARKDSGARGINYPRLLAPVISQGSANGFYPARDQDVSSTITGILTAYATSAGTDELKEFRADIFRILHLSR